MQGRGEGGQGGGGGGEQGEAAQEVAAEEVATEVAAEAARRQVAANFPTFSAGRNAELATTAQSILQNMRNHTGVSKTYRTYFNLYQQWHHQRFGQPAPLCPWTGLIWANLEVCCEFMGWMAAVKKTASQVGQQHAATC